MSKRPILIICLLFVFWQTNAQFDTSFIKSNLRRCADSLTHAFKTRNWDQFARYSYPALIGSMGGVTEFKNFISKVFSEIPDSAWKKYEPGKILQVLKDGRDFEAIIELKTIIEWQAVRTTETSFLIA